MQTFKFPDNFYWGAATSAHQVEGDNINDWSAWERKNAERLARESEKRYGRLSNWPEIKSVAQNPLNYISGRAADHYHRFKEDFDIAKELGHNAHRLSIEWSRIEPRQGEWDEKELAHYREVILALRERGIEPFVTLWHWPLPLWLSTQGGVLSSGFSDLFVIYVEKVVAALGDQVKFWITVNEPEIYSSNGYLTAKWPPQKKSLFKYFASLNSLAKAHRSAYKKIKSINSSALIGAANNMIYFEACKNRLVNRLLAYFAQRLWNEYFLNKIMGHYDFIGLNHYFHNRINYGFNKNKNKSTSDLGWEIYPEGIFNILMDLKQRKVPIYITENGIADMRDAKRANFIRDYLFEVHKAISRGTDVRGYFYWSLLDNFEWSEGFWPRFGLVAVDYVKMERTVRPSAIEYAKICKTNQLEI